MQGADNVYPKLHYFFLTQHKQDDTSKKGIGQHLKK